jgi:diguanylate cyclase (GGDEF)-like protein/PAS domain S-box-containing protein
MPPEHTPIDEQNESQLRSLARQLAQRTQELADAHKLAKLGSWYWDLQARTVRYSREAVALVGLPYTNAEFTYDQVRGLIHPDDYDRAIATYRGIIKTREPARIAYRAVWPDGSLRHLWTWAEGVTDDQDQVIGLRGTSQDVTERHEIEQALRESEDHYRHMVQLHPQIPWTAGPDGSIEEVGPKWLEITGLTRAQTLPHGWEQAVHDDDREALMAAWQHALATGELADHEYRVRRHDGSYIWMRGRAAPRRDEAGRIMRWYGTLEDVTDRRQADEARRRSENFASQVLESTGDMVVVFDQFWRVIYANSKAASLMPAGIDQTALRLEDLFAERRATSIKRRLARVIQDGEPVHFEHSLPADDVWLEINAFASAGGISLFMRDISERKRAQKQLDWAARHDFLTSAPNRLYLYEKLDACLRGAKPGDQIAILCFDIDFFKEVNDQLGHPAGDKLLKLMVYRLQRVIRTHDLLARIGGDEFAILQLDLSKPQDAEALALRILDALVEPFDLNGSQVRINISIGISVWNGTTRNGDELYKQADLALYEAKQAGRGIYKIFVPAMQERAQSERALRMDIASALARDEFSLAFQPIACVPSGVVCGAEALLRWHHPTRGLVSPQDFIPIAEAAGQIHAIGHWVLHQACRAASSWPDSMTVSVNLSPLQLEQSDIVEQIMIALGAAPLSPTRLLLEITESALLQDSPKILDDLRRLRGYGVKIVLDDFGTGYSSLSYLNRFAFDKIKIDRMFIADFDQDPQSRSILDAIMGIARALNLKVTAEGVETPAQLAHVSAIGCDDAQGFLIGRPVSQEMFWTAYAAPLTQLLPDETLIV